LITQHDDKNQATPVLAIYSPREPPKKPLKPINRPLKTDFHNGTTYNWTAPVPSKTRYV